MLPDCSQGQLKTILNYTHVKNRQNLATLLCLARIHGEPKVRVDWMELKIFWLSHNFSVPEYTIRKTWQGIAPASTGLVAVRSPCNVMDYFIVMYLLLFSLRPSSILPRTMLPFTSYLTFTFFPLNFLILQSSVNLKSQLLLNPEPVTRWAPKSPWKMCEKSLFC
jgi:hypothetical protein